MKKILERAKKDKVKFIYFQFRDIQGNIKSVTGTLTQLKEALEKGIWFDGSSIEGFARIYESDMYLVPDVNTYRVLPWTPKARRAAMIICDVYKGRKPFAGDPRFILKKTLKEAKEKGFIYNVGPEVEFFLFKKTEGDDFKPAPHDVGSYFDFSKDLASDVREEVILRLEDLGIEAEVGHHEVAPGQHEIDIRYRDALTVADNLMILKFVIKDVARTHNLEASFMPKPVFGINGSGMHVHQSFFNSKGDNLFYNRKDKYKLSQIAYQFIAGQIKHAQALSAIVAPTVNSYKRLVPGYEAPVYICWGQVNRSALVRIPKCSPGREQSTRAELRCPDPSCNPYLAFAMMLKAGLDGIKNSLKPPNPVEENVYNFEDYELKKLNIETLPSSLKEALDALEKDRVIKEGLGRAAFSQFTKAKRKEWQDYQIQVTQWELEHYLST